MKPSFYTRHKVGIFALFLFLAPLVVTSARRAVDQSSTRVADWLPEAFEETQRLHWFQEHFVSDDMLMISWEGCTFDDGRLKQLAEKLRLPVDIGDLHQVELCRQIVTGPEVLETLRGEPLRLSRKKALVRLRGWLAGEDLQSTGLILMLTPEGWEHRHFLANHILDSAATIEGLAPESLHMAGTTMDSVAIDQASQDGLQLMMLGCYAVGCALMVAMFRSIALTMAVFITALFCQQMSLCLVDLSGGHIDSVMLMIPSLIYVLSISAGVHLANYYLDAVEVHGLRHAPSIAVRHAFLPCGLASITTALGLGSLSVSFLTPIKNFGFYAAVAVILATVVVFALLPALIEQFVSMSAVRRRDNAAPESSGYWDRLREWVAHRNKLILFASIIVLVASTWGVTQIRTGARVHDLFSPNAKILQDYEWLENQIGPLVPLEVVVVIPKQTQQPVTLLDRLRVVGAFHGVISANDGIGAVISPLNLSPKISRRKRGPGNVAYETMLNKQLERNLSTFVEMARLRETPSEELWRISARAYAGQGHNYSELLEELKKSVEPILSRCASLGMSDVSVVFCGAVPLVQKAQEQMLQDLTHSFEVAFALISAMMIGLALFWSSNEIASVTRRPSIGLFLGRGVFAGLVSMIPNVLPCVAVLGGMGLLGIQLEIGSIMTASVALGIAVDDTLHFITWFRRGLAEGMSRPDAVKFAYDRCATAMTQTSLICGLGLLMFAFSGFVPIGRFAWVMFAMLISALVADLVVLPAILLGPLGKVFEPVRGAERGKAYPEHLF